MKKTLKVCVLAAAALGLWACGGGPSESAREFPLEKPRGAQLGIQVIRSETHITLTNTTAQSFGPSTLWVNRWYSRPIDGLAVGETLHLGLSSFRDNASERFSAGGFWATQQPTRLVSADLETDGELFGLVVIADRR